MEHIVIAITISAITFMLGAIAFMLAPFSPFVMGMLGIVGMLF